MRAPFALDPARYPLDRRARSGPVRLARGRRTIATSPARSRSRCRARRPVSRSRTSATRSLPWARALRARDRARQAGPAARLARGPADRVRRARAVTGSRPHARSICRTACRPRRRSTAASATCRSAASRRRCERIAEVGLAGPADRRARPAPGRRRPAGGRRAVRGRPRPLPGAPRRPARDRARRRGDPGGARAQRRADARPRALPDRGQGAGRPARTRRPISPGRRPCSPPTSAGSRRWATSRTARDPACTTHLAVVDRARHDGEPHPDPALAVRQQDRLAADRHPAQQRHHVVRSRARAGPTRWRRASGRSPTCAR